AAANRPRDLLARYGGEEFVLVLPASDEAAAAAVAERCRQAIFKAQIPHENSPLGQLITVSMGVGTTIPAAGQDSSPFIDLVDRRLYRAKQAGRNQIVSAA
ncbi:diguanylate cyclase domain-containing protein, partial [Paucibacter sp. XJ19-41]